MLEGRHPTVMPLGWRHEWSVVNTPLRSEAWERRLKDHPDRTFQRYLVKGMTRGFRIGFSYSQAKCVSATQNMASVTEHPEVVKSYLQKEFEAGRVVGVQFLRFGGRPYKLVASV